MRAPLAGLGRDGLEGLGGARLLLGCLLGAARAHDRHIVVERLRTAHSNQKSAVLRHDIKTLYHDMQTLNRRPGVHAGTLRSWGSGVGDREGWMEGRAWARVHATW